ncbi:MAG: EamA family transporter RarD [Candidatus Nanopelagicales bacterium]
MDRHLSTDTAQRTTLLGFVYALIAYGLWGAFPLYFAILDSVSPLEIVAHRVIWSLAFMLIVIAVTRGWRRLAVVLRTRRSLVILGLASIAITINWTTYVYAVSIDQVVDASLGYFINPLVSVALGVVILRERLRRAQWSAVAVAAGGVIIIGLGALAVPYIGLILAFSFGSYGLLKKMAGVNAIPGLTIETLFLFPFAAAVLALAEIQGNAAFIVDGPEISLLLLLLGPITAIPLLAYVGGANRLPLTTLGIMQYATPTILLLLGITVFGESVSAVEWIGFGLIWGALAIFSIDALRHAKRPNIADDLEVTAPT